MFDTIIADFDALYPNQVPHEIKTKWLDRLEGQMKDQFALGGTNGLIGAAPYDEVYIHYLAMKCAERGGDTVRYNNASSAFAAAYNELANHITRNTQSENVRYRHVLDLF